MKPSLLTLCLFAALGLAACRADSGGSVETLGGPAAVVAPPGPTASCPRPGHRALLGVVERRGANFVLRTADGSFQVWAISQQEMVAPHSPDLSAQEGREATICGRFDGSALYEAELIPTP